MKSPVHIYLHSVIGVAKICLRNGYITLTCQSVVGIMQIENVNSCISVCVCVLGMLVWTVIYVYACYMPRISSQANRTAHPGVELLPN